MAAVETCIILKWVDGVQVEQDLTEWYDAVGSTFVTQTWVNKTGSKLRLKIPAYLQGDGSSEPAYTIDSFQEVWVGERDGSTWTSVKFGGYVGPYTVSKPAGDHVYDISLFSYNFDLETISVTSWPMDITAFIPVESPGAEALSGYPPGFIDSGSAGYTVQEWLIGTVDPGGFPYDGVIPFHMQNVDILQGVGQGRSVDGVEDIHFSFGTKPSNSEIPGFFAATTLDNVISEILKSASYIAADPLGMNNPVNLVYWMKAVVDTNDDTRIRPKFMVRDLNNLGDVPVLVFNDSDTPADGEYSYFDLKLTVDPTDTRTVVEVFGLGAEIVAPMGAPAEYSLVYDRQEDTITDYPAPYHKPRFTQDVGGWWTTPIIEPKIETKLQAQILANTIEEAVILPRTSINFGCDVPVEEGILIQFYSQSPYYADTIPVLRVTMTGTPGRTIYNVEAGWVKPTLNEIMSGSTVDLITLRHPSPYPDSYLYYTAGTSVPDTTSSRSVDSTPDYSQRNIAQALHDHVAVGHLMPARNRTQAMSSGLPINPDGLVPPLMNAAGDVPVPQPLPAVAPAPTSVAWGTLPGSTTLTPQAWNDANNNVHPIEWSRDFTSDGWKPVTLPAPAAITTAIFMVEYNEDGTVFADFVRGGFSGGLSLTLKRTLFSAGSLGTAGTVAPFAGSAITQAVPLLVSYGMSLTVHVTGIPDGHWVTVFLSERNPDPTVFGGVPTP